MHTRTRQRTLGAAHIIAITCAVLAAISHLVLATLFLLVDAPQQVDTVRVVAFLVVATCAVVSVVVVLARAQWGRTVSIAPAILSAGVMLGIAGLTALSIGPLWLPGIVGTLLAAALLWRAE